MLINCVAAHAVDLQIRGFADIVGAQTNTDFPMNDLGTKEKHLGFDPESRLGLNLSADIGDDLVFASQILARGSDRGAYKLLADWIFVTYKPHENWNLRAGRQISPAFLYSEQIDVGYTYLWVRLPYELYGFYPIKSFNGASGIYTLPVGDYRFQAQLFGGSGESVIEEGSYVIEARQTEVRGVDFRLSSENLKFHAAYIAGRAQVKLPPNTIQDFGTLEVLSAGFSIDYGKFIGVAEFSNMISEGDALKVVKGAYGSIGYRVTDKLTPYLMYSSAHKVNGLFFMNPSLDPLATPTIFMKRQDAYMAGLNYKANPSLVFKTEYMRTQQIYEDPSVDYGADTYSVSMDIIF